MSPIFLLSLPRSGSTLLQRLLATHPQVYTVAEPWLMLPMAEAAGHENGRTMDYGRELAAMAMEDFATGYPDEMAGLVGDLSKSLAPWLTSEALRPELQNAGQVGKLLSHFQPPSSNVDPAPVLGAAALRVYTAHAAMHRPAATVFLDKTPRYYMVAGFLAQAFPEARFILLWRDPLDTLASFYSTWWDHGAQSRDHAVDLMHGPSLLAQAATDLRERICIVHYEALRTHPQAELDRVSAFMGLPAVASEQMGRLADVRLPGRMGDFHREKYLDLRPPQKEAWRRTLNSEAKLRLAAQWVESLSDEVCATFNMDKGALLAALGQPPVLGPMNWNAWLDEADRNRANQRKKSRLTRLFRQIGNWAKHRRANPTA